MDMYQIGMLVIAVLSAVVTYVVVPLLRAKLGDQQLAVVKEWVAIAVHAAEQIYNAGGQGAEKKQYVVDFLTGKGLKISMEELDKLIEAAVFEMNKTLNSDGAKVVAV